VGFSFCMPPWSGGEDVCLRAGDLIRHGFRRATFPIGEGFLACAAEIAVI